MSVNDDDELPAELRMDKYDDDDDDGLEIPVEEMDEDDNNVIF